MATSSSSSSLIAISELYPNLILSPSQKTHKVLFSKLRDTSTSSSDFVKYAQRSMRILAEDAMSEFAIPNKNPIITPCGPYHDGYTMPDPTTIVAISIIRSGDALLEIVRRIEPSVRVGKILIQRDETHPNKIPKLFYCKLPPIMTDEEEKLNIKVLLCDPMLATGGSAIMALDVLTQDPYNIPQSNIVFANMICAPEGINALCKKYPNVKIVTAQIDDCLNNDKFIVPGLGDYGDRFFNTTD